MMIRSKSRGVLAAAIALSCGLVSAADDETGKILRPADNSSHKSDQIDIVATAPSGKLQLDGAFIESEQPFPNVLHATLKAKPGVHSLVLVWEGGRKDVHFFVGPNSPAGFQPFHQHPPIPGVQCTQCHGLSRSGRFVFKGGCFDCHQRGQFDGFHTHDPGVLERCGMCHNAHGSTVKADLLYSKEAACKLCHNH
jgi:predicted CXXCH cytochrome family protein